MDEQAKRDDIERLTRIIREGSNKEVQVAVDDLREREWLRDGSLYRANLAGADLSNVDLSGSYLVEANLFGANMRDADLSRASLIETNLSAAMC